MAFWNRNRTKSLVETQFSVESPPLFSNARVILLSLSVLLLVIVIGFFAIGFLFFSGLEDTVASSPVRIIIDNAILRD